MVARLLRRYTGLITLVSLMVVLILATLGTSVYVKQRWLIADDAGLARSLNLQQLLVRFGGNDPSLNAEIATHVKLLRDGGELVNQAGDTYVFAPSNDAALQQSADQIERLIANNANQRLVSAFAQFTRAHQDHTERRKNYLLWFQIAASIVILSGFVIILLQVLTRLARVDDRFAEVMSENQAILDTTKDGVFVLDSKLRICAAQSDAARRLFGKDKRIDGDFLELIGPVVNADKVAEVKAYLEMLFDSHARPERVSDRNPFKQVECKVKNFQGQQTVRFLSFNFRRNRIGDAPGVLVTVSDITAQVSLRKELNQLYGAKRQQFENLMHSIVASDQDVASFYTAIYDALNQVNNILHDERGLYDDNRRKVNVIHAKMHRLKGNAALIGMTLIEQSAHDFESKLEQLGADAEISEDMRSSLSALLQEIFSELEFLEHVSTRLTAAQPKHDTAPSEAGSAVININAPAQFNADKLKNFARAIAQSKGKQVDLSLQGFDKTPLSEQVSKKLYSLSTQLLRNAIVHGIEPPALREQRNKPSVGQISISLHPVDDKTLKLVVRDDGAGVDLKKIKNTAIKRGLIDQQQAEAMPITDAVRLIFFPKLSTYHTTDQHAGRGYGLNVVREDVTNLGGSIGVDSTPGVFSQFTINLPSSLLLSVVA